MSELKSTRLSPCIPNQISRNCCTHFRGNKHFLELAYSKCSWFLNAYNQTCYTHWQWLFLKNNPALIELKFCLLHLLLLQIYVQAWWITTLHSVFLSLGPTIVHGNQHFTGAWLHLGLALVLADSWLVCLHSWVGGLLVLRTSGKTSSEPSSRLRQKASPSFMCCLLWHAELQNVINPGHRRMVGNK